MKFYHGNEYYYLYQIFLNDLSLRDVLSEFNLFGNDEHEKFCSSLATEFSANGISSVIENGMTANVIYQEQLDKYNNDPEDPEILSCFKRIQTELERIYKDYIPEDKTFNWYDEDNKAIYITILKTVKYGAIKYYFYENRKKYLPSYDWYLIEQDSKKATIVNALFKEFDRFTNLVDNFINYQDPDKIPDDVLIYLMELVGFTLNNYDKTFNEAQVRSLIKNLIEVYRYKGSLFAFELFFGCMGIDCGVRELYFDRRLYYNTAGKNPFTRSESPSSFGYFLTTKNPITTSYAFHHEDIKYTSLTAPISEHVWSNALSEYETAEDVDKAVRTLIGYETEEPASFTHKTETFTYFKTNYLLFDFNLIKNGIRVGGKYYEDNKKLAKDYDLPEIFADKDEYKYEVDSLDLTQSEVEVYKELVDVILPIFIKKYFVNTFESRSSERESFIVELEDTDNYSHYHLTSNVPPKKEITAASLVYTDRALDQYLAEKRDPTDPSKPILMNDGREIYDIAESSFFEVISGNLCYMPVAKSPKLLSLFFDKGGKVYYSDYWGKMYVDLKYDYSGFYMPTDYVGYLSNNVFYSDKEHTQVLPSQANKFYWDKTNYDQQTNPTKELYDYVNNQFNRRADLESKFFKDQAHTELLPLPEENEIKYYLNILENDKVYTWNKTTLKFVGEDATPFIYKGQLTETYHLITRDWVNRFPTKEQGESLTRLDDIVIDPLDLITETYIEQGPVKEEIKTRTVPAHYKYFKYDNKFYFLYNSRLLQWNKDSDVKGFISGYTFYSDREHTIPITPELNKLYLDAISKVVYRWNGSLYIDNEYQGSITSGYWFQDLTTTGSSKVRIFNELLMDKSIEAVVNNIYGDYLNHFIEPESTEKYNRSTFSEDLPHLFENVNYLNFIRNYSSENLKDTYRVDFNYYDYTNPLEYVESHLKTPLDITIN